DELPKRLRSAVRYENLEARRKYAVAKKHEARVANDRHVDASHCEATVPPEVVLAAREVDARLEADIQALKPHLREVARLRFAEEMELREIAEALGLPYELVRKRCRVAKAELRAAVLRARKAERRRTKGFESWGFVPWFWKQLKVHVPQGAWLSSTIVAA